MKKFLALILALMLVCSLAACGEAAAPTATPAPVEETSALADVVVLYTNDAHCGINEGVGYSGIAEVKNALVSQGKTVLLVDAGDAVQGDTIGTLSDGEYIIDIMNEVGYDVAVPGNHEFDYGMDQFLSLVDMADFDYVSANFVDADGNTVLDPYVIKEVNGAKIAFVGICTPKTITTSTPSYFQNDSGEYIYGFCQDDTGEGLYAAVQTAVDAAVAEGADCVVALAHLGDEADCSPWTSAEVVAATTGIDVVLDGHAHSVIEGDTVQNAAGEDVIITSTGTKLANLGCLSFTADGSAVTTLINDSGVGDFISEIEKQYEELVETVVASSDVDLVIYDPTAVDASGSSVRIVRTQETNLGDLCADAYRILSGADIAFVNGGGIRANIAAGEITYGEIIAVHPFGNEMCVVEATGQEILDALELGASKLPGESGGFLQVSGLTYEVDLAVESSVETDAEGMFVGVNGDYRVKNVMVGEEPLDVDATYTLASHNYMLKSSGDGYSMFKDNTILQDCAMIDNQVLINYIVNVLDGVVGEDYANPYGQGRITIVNG